MLAKSEQIVLVVTGESKRQLLDRVSENPDSKLPIVWLLQRRQPAIMVFETD
jgi:6-phosphogluconolactonase